MVEPVDPTTLDTLGLEPRTYHCLLLGVVLRHGDVVVGNPRLVRSLLLGIPQDVVEVGEVVVQVDAFHGVAAQAPARELRALEHNQYCVYNIKYITLITPFEGQEEVHRRERKPK